MTAFVAPRKKHKTLIIAALVLSVILASVCVYALLFQNNAETDIPSEPEVDPQIELLDEIERKAGTYDAQSIVLYNTSSVKANEIADKVGGTVRISSDHKFATVTLPEGVTVRDVVLDETNSNYFPNISLDYQVSTSAIEEGQRMPGAPFVVPTDPMFAYQDYYNYLNMKTVWNTTKGAGITVAVIDTGIDTDHPEFAGRISEYSYNASQDKIVKDYDNDWSLIEDEQGHGTSVAGVIAAAWDDNGIAGIAPEVNLLVIKADCDGAGHFLRTSDLVFGLYYAIEQNAKVINMSFGSTFDYFSKATKLAVDSDLICVAAAGNESRPTLTYPAADPNVIGVGALASDSWELADYSNYGENVNVVAPGTTYTAEVGGGYKVRNGTSLASPIVAGAIALYLAQSSPYLTFEEVNDILYASSYDLGDLGNDYYFGYGAIDLSALILEERGTVTFEMLADELDPIQQTFIRNHTIQYVPEPERQYDVFLGWYYDSFCTEPYNLYSDVFSADLTLFAEWGTEADGIPYTYVELEDHTIEIRSYTGHRHFITIPEKIEGKTVSSIGVGAFQNQHGLTQINLPTGLTVIKNNAFADCSNLTRISIPDGVSSIEERAFYNDIRLSSVSFGTNSQLQSIGTEAFANCAKLQRFHVPSAVQSIDGSVFFGAVSLKSISVGEGNTSFASRDGVLFTNSGDSIIAFPAGHSSSYDVPSGTTSIGNYAFAFSSINSIDLNGIISIGTGAFQCSELQSVTIPESVVSIGTYAFSGTTSLREITIESGLVSLPEGMLSDSMLTHVTIPSTVKAIGPNAFAGSQLKTVSFDGNSQLQSIGRSAFSNTPLESFSVPDSLISIDKGAFSCTLLTSFSIGNNSNLESIGDFAFAGVRSLTAISFNDGLESIGSYAFQSTGLSGIVTIPASVSNIGPGAFASCVRLTGFDVSEDNQFYKDTDGVIYTIDCKTIVEYPAGNPSTTYEVLPTTMIIGESAFYGSIYLSQITLSDCLTNIEMYGFCRVSGLQSITLPDTLIQISNYAFAENWNMAHAYFGENSQLPRISLQAFAYSGLVDFTVPANVSTMAQGAFEGCSLLTRVTFADNSKLPYIAAYMFDGCDNLEQIEFGNGSALKQIQAHGLEGLSKLKSIDFGDAQIESIGNYAFRFCYNLSNVSLPSTVTSIGRLAFLWCKSLSELSIPSAVEYIGTSAFYGTNNIQLYFESIALPEYLSDNWDAGVKGYYTGVSSINTDEDWKYAVLSDGSLAILSYSGNGTQIDLKDFAYGQVSIVGGGAFENTPVRNIVLPESLISVQSFAFRSSQLEEIVLPDSVTFIGQYAFSDTPLRSFSISSESTLRTIEQRAFANTPNLKSISLPIKLESMGIGAFYESGLESVVFADGIALSSIPDYGFYKTNLLAIEIPGSVEKIGKHAFHGTSNLSSITFSETPNLWIESYAFYESGLEVLTIPENVEYIGEFAFAALTRLGEYVVSEDNPYYSSNAGALMNKTGTILIAYPAGFEGAAVIPASVEAISKGAFEQGKATSVDLEKASNLLTIGYRAFMSMENLQSIQIPASIVEIGQYAFAYDYSLEAVNYDEGCAVDIISEGTYYACERLNTIELPVSVLEISDYAFFDCGSLTMFPGATDSQVQMIGAYAFAYSGLETLEVPQAVIDITDYAFLQTPLHSVSFPEETNQDLILGLGIFEGCMNLMSLTVPFIGDSLDSNLSFGYIFGAKDYRYNATFVPETLKTVVISEGMTRISDYAFDGCANLESIDLPESLDTMGFSPFSNTNAYYYFKGPISMEYGSIESYPPANVIWASWGPSQFGSGLAGKIIIAEGLKELKTDFSSRNLVEIVLPDSLEYVWANGLAVNEVTLPMNLKTVEGTFSSWIIHNNSNLEIVSNCGDGVKRVFGPDGEIQWQSEESDFELIETSDGFIFSKEQTGYTLRAYNGEDCSIVLPLTYQGNQYTIKHFVAGEARVVALPEGMDTVPENAFDIGNALNYTRGLEEIILPSTIKDIGNFAFLGQPIKTINLPDGLQTIGTRAFAFCHHLENLTLPESIISVAEDSFEGSENLHINNIPESLVTSGMIFNNQVLLEQCPSLVYEKCLLMNSDRTVVYGVNPSFAGDVYIPDSVVSIRDLGGHYSSLHLSNPILRDISLPFNCSVYFDGSLEEWMSMSRPVQWLNGGFWSVTDRLTYDLYIDGQLIKNLDLSDYKMSMMSASFSHTSIESITLPDTVTSLDSYAFWNCTALKSINMGKIDWLGWRALDGSAIVELDLSSFDTLDNLLFSNMKNLTKVVLSENVTVLPHSIFSGSPIEEINLEHIERIEDYALEGCQIEYLNLSNVDYIGYSAFGGSGVKNVVLPQSIGCTSADWFSNSTIQSIIIPEGITRVGGFYHCSNLTSISLPESLEIIDSIAFEGCTNLSEITLPSNLQSIGDLAFFECSSLTTVRNNSSLEIDPTYGWDYGQLCRFVSNYYDAEGNETIIQTNKLYSEEDFVYAIGTDGYAHLRRYVGESESITMPSTLGGLDTVLDGFILGNAKNVTIPGSMQVIPQHAFAYVQWIDSITFEEGVVRIENNAFYGLRFSSISFPTTINYIGKDLFDDTQVFMDYLNSDENCLVIDNCLIHVKDTKNYTIGNSIICVAEDAFRDCTSLTFLDCGRVSRVNLEYCDYLSTIIVGDVVSDSYQTFVSAPNLKNVIVKKDSVFESILYPNEKYEFSIFFEDVFNDWMKYYDWHGVKYYPREKWSMVSFFDSFGAIISADIYLKGSVIRMPHTENTVNDFANIVHLGWDIDGDGFADRIPLVADNYDIEIVELSSTEYVYSIEYDPIDGNRLCAITITSDNLSLPIQLFVDYIPIEELDPTCESDGLLHFAVSGAYDIIDYSTESSIILPALGHAYSAAYAWSDDGKTCTVTITCANDKDHDTVIDGTVTSAVRTPATCTEPGITTYSVSGTYDGFAYADSKDVTDIPALGHKYVDTVTAPTCTERGYTTHVCSECQDTYVDSYVDALGHDYHADFVWSDDGKSCTVNIVCSRDASHSGSVVGSVNSKVTVPATCETAGTTTYYVTAEFDGKTFEDSKSVQDIPAFGHDYSATYEWSADGKSCKVVIICAVDSAHSATLDAVVASSVKVDATTSSMGVTSYSVSGTYDGFTYSDSKDVRDIPALEPVSEEKESASGKTYGNTVTENVTTEVSSIFNTAKDNNASVEVSVPTTSAESPVIITFDDAAVKAIGGNDVTITANLVSNSTVISDAEVVLEVILDGAKFSDGKATVYIPYSDAVPAGKTVKVYFVNGSDRTDMNATLSDGYIVFETNHFSSYAVVLEDVPSDGNGNGSEFPIMYAAIGAIAVLALAGGAIVVKKHKA
ncbi:leucine-rich repeat protein [Methanomethylophilus alvi]|uniref:leucine-rich repeat protein n=1 Tax=Methanomethylophilus alvi TaxID=1291540 RepID=UPI0037DD7C67